MHNNVVNAVKVCLILGNLLDFDKFSFWGNKSHFLSVFFSRAQPDCPLRQSCHHSSLHLWLSPSHGYKPGSNLGLGWWGVERWGEFSFFYAYIKQPDKFPYSVSPSWVSISFSTISLCLFCIFFCCCSFCCLLLCVLPHKKFILAVVAHQCPPKKLAPKNKKSCRLMGDFLIQEETQISFPFLLFLSFLETWITWGRGEAGPSGNNSRKERRLLWQDS